MCWQEKIQFSIQRLLFQGLLLFFILLLPVAASADSDSVFGSYHALVIGNQNYKHLTDLKTPLADARAVAKVLKEQYGFTVELLEDADRYQIFTAMERLRTSMQEEKSNLLIYYAGHGFLDPAGDVGYWQPVDAEKNNPANWIPIASVTNFLKVIQARHILVVADACFSGKLLMRDSGVQLPSHLSKDIWLGRMLKKRSRTALTSGGIELVQDFGSNGHSVFAAAFITALRTNQGILDGDSLFELIKRPVALNAKQTPQYGDIRWVNHDGGDFLLVPKQFQQEAGPLQDIFKRNPGLLRGGSSTSEDSVIAAIDLIDEEYEAVKNGSIRKQPTISSLRIGSLKKGDKIWVAGRVHNQPWFLVDQSDGQGYVYADLLQQAGAVVIPIQAVTPEKNSGDWSVLKQGDTMTDKVTGMKFVYVPKGCFKMGSPVDEDGHDTDEGPVHEVCVDAFWMGKYEVTQGEWQTVMDDNPAGFQKGTRYPVEQVSWDDTQSFISKLKSKSNTTYRLPTEAEWEYACRANKGSRYCGGNTLNDLAWSADNSDRKTHPVGTKQANDFKLHDMSGNVWEWCSDWYGEEYYTSSLRNNPTGPSGGSLRVLRGGSWDNSAGSCRSALRFINTPVNRYANFGFRLALSPGQQ